MARNFDENSRVKIPALLHLTRLNYRYISYRKSESLLDCETNIYKKSFQAALNQINQSDFGAAEINSIILELDTLTENDITQIITEFVEFQEMEMPKKDLLDKLTTNLKGLSETKNNNILSLAVSENGMLTYSDIPLVLEQKQQMIRKSGILEMIRVKESMEDIGDLENLKDWINRKNKIFKNIKKAQNFGVDIPKGVQ